MLSGKAEPKRTARNHSTSHVIQFKLKHLIASAVFMTQCIYSITIKQLYFSDYCLFVYTISSGYNFRFSMKDCFLSIALRKLKRYSESNGSGFDTLYR